MRLAKPGPEVCRVEWDGKDRQLSIRSTPTQATVMMKSVATP
jgi:hypothetical protein